jgi:hypothetical protein
MARRKTMSWEKLDVLATATANYHEEQVLA